jgi:hypothetical protein
MGARYDGQAVRRDAGVNASLAAMRLIELNYNKISIL